MRVKLRFAAILVCIITLSLLSQEAYSLGLKGKLDSPSRNNNANKIQNRHVLPKRGDIAVLVEGSNAQHVRTTEAAIVEMLVSRGYRVVDEAKMRRIRAAAVRAKAARLALEGNVEGIMKLNAGYSAAATIVARVQAGKPVENEFQLYTCTSSVALMAVTSNGTKLGGRTAQGKQIGYTEDEAQQKAIDAAVASGMEQMF